MIMNLDLGNVERMNEIQNAVQKDSLKCFRCTCVNEPIRVFPIQIWFSQTSNLMIVLNAFVSCSELLNSYIGHTFLFQVNKTISVKVASIRLFCVLRIIGLFTLNTGVSSHPWHDFVSQYVIFRQN